MKKYKRKIIIGAATFLVIECIHLFVYINYGLNGSAIYINEFITNCGSYALEEEGHYLDLISYGDLSPIYKIVVDEEEFINADTDKECFEIYNSIIEHTSSQKSSSFYTTYGMKKGTYYEELIVDDVRYRAKHNIDVKTNYFTFKPYISKWMITIEETA